MKIKHRVPFVAAQSAEVSADYEREVQAATDRLAAAYRRAQKSAARAKKRVEIAERKVESAARTRSRRHQLASEAKRQRALYAEQLAELQRLDDLMRQSPCPSAHRGADATPPPVLPTGRLI